MVDPQVFIDCRDAELYHFRSESDKPIIDQLTAQNRPHQNLVQKIAVGRIEDRKSIEITTIAFTVIMAIVMIVVIINKAKNSEIYIQSAK